MDLIQLFALLASTIFASPQNADTMPLRAMVRPVSLDGPGNVSKLPKAVQQNLQMARRATAHAFRGSDGGFHAENPGQAWSATFDGRGCSLASAGGDWRWGLELRSFGFAESMQQVKGTAAGQVTGSQLTYTWTSNLQEWYVNDSRGLEHGYTLTERPAQANGEISPLVMRLNILGDLSPQLIPGGQGIHFVDSQGKIKLQYTGLYVFDAHGVEQSARMECAGSELRIIVDESLATYPLTIDPVVQDAYLKASNTDSLDFFGTSVGTSGDTVIVGAPYESSSSSEINGDQSDNSAVRAGAAYVFTNAGGTWVQEAYLKAPNTDADDFFGAAVAISGDTAVVGAWKESSDATGVGGDQGNNNSQHSGAAYVYRRSSGIWTLEAYLKPNPAHANLYFGSAVAIDGDTVVVGAHRDSSTATGVNGSSNGGFASGSGAAYIFVRSGNVWNQDAYLKASNTDANDHFGTSVSVAGDTVVIGSYGEDSASTGVNGIDTDNTKESAGAAYVFRKTSGVWAQEAYLKASKTSITNAFGYSVSVSGNTIVVGSPYENGTSTGINGPEINGLDNSGAAYIFERVGTIWSQQAYMKASYTLAHDNFGWTVACSGDQAVVCAVNENGSSTGVNGDQTPFGDSNGSNSGATYLFSRESNQWSEQAYIKASNTGGGDAFGTSVALSNGMAVVGSQFERSSATGVNGNQADNSSAAAGAAYVYNLQSAACSYCEATPNSTGQRGRLAMSGSSQVSSHSFGLRATGLPPGEFGYFLNSMGQEFVTNPGGSQGNLCIGGSQAIGRHLASTQAADASGVIAATIDLQILPSPTGPIAVLPGDTWNFQCWYRDQNPASTSNFTEALSVEFY